MSVTRQILIAGGSGLIGKRLSSLLESKGYEVRILSRSEKSKSRYKTYLWDPSKNEIDSSALTGVFAIVNLAGSGIADHSWTKKYKEEILQSRLAAAATLLNAIKEDSTVQSYIAASAIGYYGDRPGELLTEKSKPGSGFLSDTVVQWEAASENCAVRRVVIRTGIVLSRLGGALPPQARSVKAMIAPVINGNQKMSWIHIDDLCNIYFQAIENTTWEGIVNGTTPSSVSQQQFIEALKQSLNPSALKIKVPVSILKLLIGERSRLILDSADVKPEKLLQEGFTWKHTDLNEAIKNLYGF